MGGIVGKWGVPGVNENGECLVDLCAERGLFLANTFFEHKMIHRYTWRRGRGNEEQKSLIDYVVIDDRMKGMVDDAKVVRGMFPDSDHFAVLAKVRAQVGWVWKKERVTSVMRVAKERLREVEFREKYKEGMARVWDQVREEIGRMVDVGDAFQRLKDSMLEVVESVCGRKRERTGNRKGHAWWTKDIEDAIREKKIAYDKLNERNISARVRRERKEKYRDCKTRVRRLIRESRKRVDEEFGRKLSSSFKENKKLFWKETRRERGEKRCGGERVKSREGIVLREGEEVRERWREHFEGLGAVNSEREAVITCMGMSGGGGRPIEQGMITKREVRRAIERLKLGKAAGADGITAEMLKFGGEPVIEWMHKVCSLAWQEGRVPDDWVRAILVPVYKGKGAKDECGNYRGISLLSIPGKVYGRIIIERVREITEEKISKEQGGFMKGKGCIDQIFSVKMLVEKYLGKGKKLYAAFMDLE